jgi:hypothetical protein
VYATADKKLGKRAAEVIIFRRVHLVYTPAVQLGDHVFTVSPTSLNY